MILDNANSLIFVLIPFLLILVSTVCMISFLQKRRSLRRQNIALILSVSILHLVSCVPYLLYVIIMNILKPSPAVKFRSSTVAQLYAAANYVNYLNTMCNCVLYYFTSASFSAYVRGYSRKWLGRVARVGDVELNTGATRSTSVSERECRRVQVEHSC